jgi:23S rRNA (cytidine2498-2'-O)-methyltransferase
MSAAAAARGIGGFCRAQPGSGYVLFQGHDDVRPLASLRFASLIFPRQWLLVHAELRDLPEKDRATPIAETAGSLGAVSEIWLEHPDTNEGKALSSFLRKFERPLQQALGMAGVRAGNAAAPRLQLFFLDSRHVFVGTSAPDNSAAWPMGIPRLRLPRSAPSRSTLKLEEALHVFLSPAERARRLAPGMTGVDLGAAPGGWTWQLAHRGLHVAAVDNGPMAAEIMASGMVEHFKADGFTFRPAKAVDWLVCDMVEQPTRIAALIADWLANGRCRESIFNLKLPMKKRYQTVRACLEHIERRTSRAAVSVELACKQLYHDREEVTVHARRL